MITKGKAEVQKVSRGDACGYFSLSYYEAAVVVIGLEVVGAKEFMESFLTGLGGVAEGGNGCTTATGVAIRAIRIGGTR